MLSSAARFLCCGILLSICSFAVLSQQTLRTKLTDGSYLENPSNIEEGTEVTLECTFDAYSGTVFRTIRLGTSDGTGGVFVFQVGCQQIIPQGGTFSSSLFANNDVANGNLPNYFLNSTLFCDSTSMTATFRVMRGWPSTYVCLAVYANNVNVNNSKSVIRTHKEPNEPNLEIISSPTVPFEGDEMVYQCTSSGRPAPKLRLSYGGKVIDTGLVHIPSIDTINEDGAEAVSTLTWTATASRAYNKEDLTCQIYDHPYKISKESSIPMAVYFGPDNSLNNKQTWNMKATDKHIVSCDFDSNGGLTYRWYNSSVSPENLLLESTRNYTLQKSDFPDVTAGSPTSMVLYCVGTNLQNNAVTAQWRVNITITPPDAVTVNPGGSTGDKTGGLAWYIYLIIAVGVIAALAIIVALIVFCRNRASPANKKKAAIKKESNGYNSSGDNSGAVTNPDIMRNNYRGGDLGSPPLNNSNPDYRYSQHVEDYADAIDDKPRSRKPIAYSMDELNLDAGYPDQSPYIEGGPPAYHTHDPNSLYHRDYMSTPLASQSSYSANYGAPC